MVLLELKVLNVDFGVVLTCETEEGFIITANTCEGNNYGIYQKKFKEGNNYVKLRLENPYRISTGEREIEEVEKVEHLTEKYSQVERYRVLGPIKFFKKEE